MAQAKNLRLRWAKKILRAKNFVVVTDKESVIALEGVNPDNLNDHIMLAEQSASIDSFKAMLDNLQRKHNKRLEEISNDASERKTTKPKKEAKS